MRLHRIARMLCLLAAANGAPYAAGRALGRRFAGPIDGDARFLDGQPLFGPSKTVRGLFASAGATVAVALCLGLSPAKSVPFAGLAMTGDLLSSFVKRRLRRPAGAHTPGVDQLPEAILPALHCIYAADVTVSEAAVAVMLFCVALEAGAPLRAALDNRRSLGQAAALTPS